jgi:tRNA nucleotidyltransferase (CCA-adding enzyme)
MKNAPQKIVLCLSSIDFDALAASLCISKLYPGTVAVKVSGLERSIQMFMGIYKDFIRLTSIDDIDKNAVEELFIVDTRLSKKLFDFIDGFKNLKRCIIFDHHSGGLTHPSYKMLQMEVGSTTTMLVPLLRKRKIYISPQEATVMLTGIYEDTATLISPTTTPQDLETASFLLSAGGNLQTVRRFLSTALDQRGKDVLKLFLDNIEVFPMGGILVAISCVRYKDYVQNLAFITHKLFDLVEADAIITAAAMAGNTHFVGRSLDDRLVDVSKILSHFGGGGHKTASAAKITGELDEKTAFYRVKRICEEEIIPPPTVTSIMSQPVKNIDPETTVGEAQKYFHRFGHSGLPVVNNDRIIGIITRRDLDKVPLEFYDKQVKRFMTSNIITIDPQASIVEARRLMMKRSVGRLPVVAEGKVVGIVTRSDVLKASFWHRGQDIGLYPPPTKLEKTQTKELFSRLPSNIKEMLVIFTDIANVLGLNFYLVGGAVRDIVMGRNPQDIDLLVEGDAISLAMSIHKKTGGKIITHERFGTARLIIEGMQYDFATARAEYYTESGVHPKVLQSSIREDLLRRDFTINAMALGLYGQSTDEIIDYCGGLDDIASKKVRILHNLSFVEDPTRVLRAIYYAQILDFEIEKETDRLACDAIKTGLLSTAKNERTVQEFDKILVHQKGSQMLIKIEEFDGLSTIFGEIPEKLKSTLQRADKLAVLSEKYNIKPDIKLLRMLILSSELDRGSLRENLTRLRMPGKFIEQLDQSREGSAVLSQLIPTKDSLMIFKASRNLNDSAIIYACMAQRLTDSLKNIEMVTKLRNVKLEITGNDLIAVGVKSGKTIGEILESVLYEKSAGRLGGYKEEMQYARWLINE